MQSIGAVVTVTLAGFILVLGKQLSVLSTRLSTNFRIIVAAKSPSQTAVGNMAGIHRDWHRAESHAANHSRDERIRVLLWLL